MAQIAPLRLLAHTAGRPQLNVADLAAREVLAVPAPFGGMGPLDCWVRAGGMGPLDCWVRAGWMASRPAPRVEGSCG